MMVNCVAYKEGQKLADLSIDQISEYVSRPETFVWVALRDPDAAELEIMRKEFNLHELAVEDAQQGHQRPKIEEYGASLFVVLHTVEVISSKGELEVGELDVFVGNNYILSIRHKTTKGYSQVRERCERESVLLKNGSGFVLYALMDTVVDRYFPAVDALEQELEDIEERIFSRTGSGRNNIEELYTLKRKLMILQHAAGPLLETVGKLYGGRVPPMCQGMQEYFRDVYDHVIRISKSIETIREMITIAIQVNLSLIAVNESEVTKKLASYGALFAVPTAIAGIYGMNFKFMPELDWAMGYPVTLITIFCLDVLLWWRFRRAGWL